MLLGRRGEVTVVFFSSFQVRPISLFRSGIIFIPRKVTWIDNSPRVDHLPPAGCWWDLLCSLLLGDVLWCAKDHSHERGAIPIKWIVFSWNIFGGSEQLIEFLSLEWIELVTTWFSTNYGKYIRCRLWWYHWNESNSYKMLSPRDVTDTSWLGTRYSCNQDMALLTNGHIPGGLHCGASGRIEWLPLPPKTGLFSQLFRVKAFQSSLPPIHMLIGDI